MRPIGVESRRGKGFVIVHECVACGFRRPNRVADDPLQSDDIAVITALMAWAG
jgi:RNHCP domain-containing protein